MTTNTTSGAADLPEALRRSTAADGKTELFNLPGYPLMVRAVDFNRVHAESEMRRAALLDEMQKTALAAGQATAAQQGAYAALSESFLEIPDVQDESGINAYYSREVVLECIDAALASHGQAPAGAAHEADSAPAVGYPPLPNLDGSDEQIWGAIFNWKTATPGADAVRKANKVENAIIGTMRACVDADRAARAPADSVQEDAARWNAWSQAMVECANSYTEPEFFRVLRDTSGDAELPITLQQFNAWIDAARTAQKGVRYAT